MDNIGKKNLYRDLCVVETTIPLFSKDWWLDAVCGKENWSVAVALKDGKIVASWPYYIKRRSGLVISTMPLLTQSLGVWYKKDKGKYNTKLANEKKYLSELLSQMPKIAHFSQNFHFTFENWLPLYWKGFKQSTYYTYRIDKGQTQDELWSGLQGNIRTDIRKAEEKFNLKIDSNGGISEFYSINKMTFERQNSEVPYSMDFIEEIENTCSNRKSSKILFARDDKNQIHGAVYLVWDEFTIYYLAGGADAALRNSGVMSLLIWKSLLFAMDQQKDFDFEGSMIEPIEKFVRGFGAIQTPYFSINKTDSKLLHLFMALKGK